MSATVFLLVMSSSFFNPNFAFSSHFDSDGAPLSELSWSSSLAVVAVSFSGLFTFIFLMLACLCCKKGEMGFKEFENADGEDYQTDLSTLASPVSQSSTDVYILPLTEVSLPVSKQPARSVQLIKSTDVGRRSLLYVKEIGHGWFGKVLLGEVTSGLDSTQVVVKELRASASVQDQIHFLEEAQPYRALQHPALLQCLAQCSEATPYLLIMEFCPLGDLKGYLRSCRAADSLPPDPLILQRMACEISSGLLQLHKHNFIHGDLALRNCLMTSDLTVKIGDYGLSHSKYKDDYFVTPDQLWVPLRWIGPELIDEVHGNLLLVDQTKPSNIWAQKSYAEVMQSNQTGVVRIAGKRSLGVMIWELFELGNQPYRHYSDQQVLTYALKEQQLRLPKPLLELPLSERWYEVMQFCWLPPEQRPNAEEVHLLVTYLCARGASEAEDDFEKRWNSLRPNGGHALSGLAPPPASSFPLLQHFPPHPEPGDDILTVTETSRGLNFEYQWEQARPKAQGTPSYHQAFYPPVPGGLALGVSPSYYEPQQLPPANMLTAPSPSLASEYYMRLEGRGLDYPGSYSPEYQGSSGSASFLTGSGDSGECLGCPALPPPDSYWSTDIRKAGAYDWDGSPTLSLTTEPLLAMESCSSPTHAWETGPSHPCSSPKHRWDTGSSHPCSSPAHSNRLWETGHYVSYKDRDGGYYYEPPPSLEAEPYLLDGLSEPLQESWGSRSLRQALGELENPLGISPSVCSPGLSYNTAPYLLSKGTAGGCYYSMMEPMRNTMPRMARGGSHHHINPHFTPPGWASNRSSNNNSLQSQHRPAGGTIHHFHYTMPSTDVEDSWPMTAPIGGLSCYPHDCTPLPPFKDRQACSSLPPAPASPPCPRLHTEEGPQFIDPLTGVMVHSYAGRHHKKEQTLPPIARGGAALGGVVLRGQAWAPHPGAPGEPRSISSHTADSGVGQDSSSISLVEICDCSDDDDITDITSGVFLDFPAGGSDSEQRGTPDLSPTQKQAGTPDSIKSIDLLPSPDPPSPPSSTTPAPPSPPKALDSGYDTENNESPEFVLKEPHDPPSGKPAPSGASGPELGRLCESTVCRDSAYFSDCDVEGERAMQDQGAEPVKTTPSQELCCLPTEGEGCLSEELSQHLEEESSAECPTPSASPKPTAGEELLNEGPASDSVSEGSRLLNEGPASDSVSEGSRPLNEGPASDSVSEESRLLKDDPASDSVSEESRLLNEGPTSDSVSEESRLLNEGPASDSVSEESRLLNEGPTSDSVSEESRLLNDDPASDSVSEGSRLLNEGPASDSASEESRLLNEGPASDSASEESRLLNEGPASDSVSEGSRLLNEGPASDSVSEESRLLNEGPASVSEESRLLNEGPASDSVSEESRLLNEGPASDSVSEESRLLNEGPASDSEESRVMTLLELKKQEGNNKELLEAEDVEQVGEVNKLEIVKDMMEAEEVMEEKEVKEVHEVETVQEVEEVAEDKEEMLKEGNEEAHKVKEAVDVEKDMKEADTIKEEAKKEVEEEVEVVRSLKEETGKIKEVVEEEEPEVEVMTEVEMVKEVEEEAEGIKEKLQEEIKEELIEEADMIKEEVKAEVITKVMVEKEVKEKVLEGVDEEKKEVKEEVEDVKKEIKEEGEELVKIKEEVGEVKEEVVEEVDEEKEEVKEEVEEVKKEIKEEGEELVKIKEDVGEVKEEVEELKKGIKEKVEMGEIKEDVGEIKEEVKEDSSSGALLGQALGPQKTSGVSSLLGGRVSPVDGEEGDSEDSEESDEELRSYTVQEQSEEDNEEDSQVVPLVVSSHSNACHLRSLLRTSLSPTRERKAKTVSFYHHVTVYLFDQESPTRELAEAEQRGPEGETPPTQERVSDDSLDGNLSEENGGLEWEDDFPSLPGPSLMMSSSEAQPAARFSRFSVSRFSITHVTDSDMDSAGGSSEDGERE